MIKITIHIENGYVYMDEDVCKDVMLQCLPRIGDPFWLNPETQKQFCNAVHELNLYVRYCKWLYGKSSNLPYDEILSCDKEMLREDFSLDDVYFVKGILFKENGEIHIELSDNV